jgi:AcrR family transcriptional regulator
MSSDSSTGSRALQKTETKNRILAEAKVLCARQGFVGTRTIDVARAARVSHGSVFAHFPSREELMTAVVSEMALEITDALHQRASRGGAIGDILAAHLECLAEQEDQVCWLLREAPALPNGFLSAWVGLQSAVSFHISQAAEREMAAGQVRPMPLHLLFNTWVGLVHHYLINRELFAPGRSVLREHGRTLLEHFMNLIATSPTNARRRERR